MRLCMTDDLLAGARALSCLPEAAREALAERLLTEAHAAHHYAKRLRRPHPVWGNGSLMARALAELPPNPATGPCFSAVSTMARAIFRFRERCPRNRRLGLSSSRPIC